jgi:HEAT repeat protein
MIRRYNQLLAASAALLCAAALPAQAPRGGPLLAMAAEMPPAPRWAQDPADPLYRQAREALNRRDYAVAARLFQRIRQEHPSSRYTPDSMYWEAFARYRTGGMGEMRTALGALDAQRARYPRATTRRDADELATRIRGELARRGDSGAARQVERSAVRAARSGTSCGEADDTQVAALNALSQMDAGRGLPVLERVLARRDECSAELREKAVFMVSRQGTAESETILMRVARNDPSPRVREQAVFWLSSMGTERSLQFIEEILRTSGDMELRDKALFALSRHPNPRAQAALRSYAEASGSPDELREKAIFWIGQRGTPESATYLRGLFGRLTDAEMKQKLLHSISRTRGSERWLLGVAGDASQPEEVRKQALFWAGRSGVPTSELAAAYDALRDREMREQVIFVLSQRGDAAAVDKLIAIARRDPDSELRQKAVFWLGRSRDPRAAQALGEIIGS